MRYALSGQVWNVIQSSQFQHSRAKANRLCVIRAEERFYVASAMQVADHFDGILGNAIEDEVTARRRVAKALGDVVARAPSCRVLRHHKRNFVKPIKQIIGGLRVIGRDIPPDGDQVALGLGGDPIGGHSEPGRLKCRSVLPS